MYIDYASPKNCLLLLLHSQQKVIRHLFYFNKMLSKPISTTHHPWCVVELRHINKVAGLCQTGSEENKQHTVSWPTCQKKEDSVVSIAGSLDSLDTQMAVVVLCRHHGQISSHRPNTVVCQEVFFDKAQGVV